MVFRRGKKNKSEKKKSEKKKGKIAGWLVKTDRKYISSDNVFNKKEKFYHFGNVSIKYNGKRTKECELHIIADNTRLHTSKFKAKNDRGFNNNTQWLMNNSAKVVVTSKNRREKIFEIDVPKAKVKSSSAKIIKLTSGDFTIEFSVYMNSVYKNRTEYQYKLFEKSNNKGVWKHIDKTKLLKDLKNTVNMPTNVNQEDAGFCGATALAYALVSSQPHRFIQFCQELYEIGSFKGVEKSFRTSKKFRDNRAPHNLTFADYLFTGTLMEDAGFKKQHSKAYLDDNDKLRDNFNAEGSGSPAQKRWCREILGYQNIKGIGKKFSLGKQVKDLVECNKKMKANGFVFPCINADILKRDIKKKPIRKPNHWVTLEKFEIFDKKGKKMTINSDNIKKTKELYIIMYSWGKDYIGRIPTKEYKKFVWLYITCEPFKTMNVIQQLKDVK